MKKPIIYAISSMKGGVGKTLTSLQIGDYFSKKGKKALLVDLDEQKNLSIATNMKQIEVSSYDVLLDPSAVNNAIHKITDYLYIIPSSNRLASIDTELTELGKEQRLKEAFEQISITFDYIIIDTPPAFKLATLNAFCVPNVRIITPVLCDDFGINSINELTKFIIQVKKYANPTLTIEGILLTMYSSRNILSRQYTIYIEKLAEQIGTKVFKSRIRTAIAIREALNHKQSIFDYAPTSKIAVDYENFIKELEE